MPPSKDSVPATRIFSTYDESSSRGSLGNLLTTFLDDQKRKWLRLAEDYAALESVKHREVDCDGYSVLLQFNPRRIVSTAAAVDEKSLRRRTCFLCVENLPEKQQGILYAGNFLVLCNPVPIFARHFTISFVSHIPQELDRSIPTFLSLAEDLAPQYSVFYNGPRCGASAPDHLHFQACPTGAIPVELAAADGQRRVLEKKTGSVALFTLREFGRQVLVLESDAKKELAISMSSVLSRLAALSSSSEEPMVNTLCSYSGGRWRAILFPRSRHRPSFFFRHGEEQIMVSPALVDMGGLIVTPMEKDFERMNAEMVQNIFNEVSVTEATLARVTAAL